MLINILTIKTKILTDTSAIKLIINHVITLYIPSSIFSGCVPVTIIKANNDAKNDKKRKWTHVIATKHGLSSNIICSFTMYIVNMQH